MKKVCILIVICFSFIPIINANDTIPILNTVFHGINATLNIMHGPRVIVQETPKVIYVTPPAVINPARPIVINPPPPAVIVTPPPKIIYYTEPTILYLNKPKYNIPYNKRNKRYPQRMPHKR